MVYRIKREKRRKIGLSLNAFRQFMVSRVGSELGFPRSVAPRAQAAAHRLAFTAIAQGFLVRRKMIADFEYRVVKPIGECQRLKVLLEHVALANYNRALVNWNLGREVYREFVLSPIIRADSQEELKWRRPLWESFLVRGFGEN